MSFDGYEQRDPLTASTEVTGPVSSRRKMAEGVAKKKKIGIHLCRIQVICTLLWNPLSFLLGFLCQPPGLLYNDSSVS